MACPEYLSIDCLQLVDIDKKKKGLARILGIQCITCPCKEFFHINRSPESSGGSKHMELNARTVYGMRSIGAGYSQLEKKLCTYLNMPLPMNNSAYKKLSDNVKDAVKDVAEKSMADVSKEFRGDNDEKDVISIDGTW